MKLKLTDINFSVSGVAGYGWSESTQTGTIFMDSKIYTVSVTRPYNDISSYIKTWKEDKETIRTDLENQLNNRR